jgi:hypothetical protein
VEILSVLVRDRIDRFRNYQEFVMEIGRYWGIHFPDVGQWLKRTDGSIFFYPSPYIAQAQLNGMRQLGFGYEGAVVDEFNGKNVEAVIAFKELSES